MEGELMIDTLYSLSRGDGITNKNGGSRQLWRAKEYPLHFLLEVDSVHSLQSIPSIRMVAGVSEQSPLVGGSNGHRSEQQPEELHRHLSLFDLVCIGVGATVGSGVFVLIGLIAHTSAGPAVFLSWGIAGVAALASGLCYAELGGRFPEAGSSYLYAKETMGELASVIAAACLTLEYTGSASAVARSWGDKVVEYVRSRNSESILISVLDPGLGINPCAFVVSLASVLLLLEGVKESKSVTNFFSTLNVSLVMFMALMSMILAKRENLTPLVPPEFGAAGILRGATSSFFGYIGFDEICCVSGEAKNPSKNVPRAIILTLIIVTSLYISASLGLAGMVPYEEISETSGFPNGFRYVGYGWAADITAVSYTCLAIAFIQQTIPIILHS
eukprot:scaffold27052_cov169-Skeletonema_menzelii.AAC.7